MSLLVAVHNIIMMLSSTLKQAYMAYKSHLNIKAEVY